VKNLPREMLLLELESFCDDFAPDVGDYPGTFGKEVPFVNIILCENVRHTWIHRLIIRFGLTKSSISTYQGAQLDRSGKLRLRSLANKVVLHGLES
jgi:hypothetical protein